MNCCRQKKQQSAFTPSRDISDAAVKASYLIAQGIAVASKPFSEGKFVKSCMANEGSGDRVP